MSTQCLRRWAAALVAAAVLTSAPLARAAEPLQTRVTALPKGAVKKRYRAGQESFEQGRFEEAGRSFADVLDLIPETPHNRAVRSTVVLDAIAAWRGAYEQSGEVADLQMALETYYRYFEVYETTYGSPNIPPGVVEARFALKEAIARAENDGKTSPPPPPDAESSEPANADTETDTETTSNEQVSSSAPKDAAPAGDDPSSGGRVAISTAGGKPADRSGTPLIAAGAAVLAVGVGASSMIAVGAIEGQRAREDSKLPGYTDEQRNAIDQRGRTMNAVFIAGLVSTPLLVGTGAALLGIGVKRHRKARVTAVLPKVKGNFVGLTVKGRF